MQILARLQRAGERVIAKFYRPGRWSRDALQDEQDFLAELEAQEIPVIAPLRCVDGELLQHHHGLHFAIFPKRGGRPLDEPGPHEWPQLGRLLARMHSVGAEHAPRDRVTMHPAHVSAQQVAFILDCGVLPAALRKPYETAARSVLELIAPFFDGIELHRIHGDCHRGNILHRPGEGLHLIDFDDMAVGPAVQDIWMLLPGTADEARVELELLIEGYETFLDFPRESLRLIEPLRAMRFIHYTAWCARQKADGGFARLAPDWGGAAFWKQEIEDLEEQAAEIRGETG